MSGRLLLVSGSRILYGGGQAPQTWAYSALLAAIDEADPRPTLVVNGGAEGPDRVSSQIACELGIPVREFHLDGWVRVAHKNNPARVSSRWRDANGPAVSPLERNRQMVARCVRARDEGWRVHVLALIAPWAKTHGTAHTAARAERDGLKVTRLTCPSEYGGHRG